MNIISNSNNCVIKQLISWKTINLHKFGGAGNSVTACKAAVSIMLTQRIAFSPEWV